MLLPITLITAAAAALLNLWLGSRIVRLRLSEKILHGDGANPRLSRRMRAQANFTENTPIVLILFGLVEMALGSAQWLWIAALAYIVARVSHAFGMDRDGPNLPRAAGMGLTWLVTIALALAALYGAYTAMAWPSAAFSDWA